MFVGPGEERKRVQSLNGLRQNQDDGTIELTADWTVQELLTYQQNKVEVKC